MAEESGLVSPEEFRETVESPLKWDLLRRIGKDFGLDTLVETGGYHGSTMEYLKDDFKRLVTIEYGPWLFQEIYDRNIPNLLCLYGDSGRVLRQFLMFYTEPALFFLDAHPSGGDTADFVGPSVPEREIRAILERNCVLDVVFVDDIGHPGLEKETVEGIVREYPNWSVMFAGEFPVCVGLISRKDKRHGSNIPDLTVEQIEMIRPAVETLLPGQNLHIRNGVFYFSVAEAGRTEKGDTWDNVSLTHQENTTHHIRDRALPWLVGKGADLGCGVEKVVPDCVGIDSTVDFAARTCADDVRDFTDLTGYADGQFDWVYSANSIEHVENWREALREWVRVLRPGGVIFLYAPWPEKHPMLSASEIESHKWNPTPTLLSNELDALGVDVIECDSDADTWGCFVIIGRKRGVPAENS